jgi:hypothetical protein
MFTCEYNWREGKVVSTKKDKLNKTYYNRKKKLGSLAEASVHLSDL